jgi:hypothetical protein
MAWAHGLEGPPLLVRSTLGAAAVLWDDHRRRRARHAHHRCGHWGCAGATGSGPLLVLGRPLREPGLLGLLRLKAPRLPACDPTRQLPGSTPGWPVPFDRAEPLAPTSTTSFLLDFPFAPAVQRRRAGTGIVWSPRQAEGMVHGAGNGDYMRCWTHRCSSRARRRVTKNLSAASAHPHVSQRSAGRTLAKVGAAPWWCARTLHRTKNVARHDPWQSVQALVSGIGFAYTSNREALGQARHRGRFGRDGHDRSPCASRAIVGTIRAQIRRRRTHAPLGRRCRRGAPGAGAARGGRASFRNADHDLP